MSPGKLAAQCCHASLAFLVAPLRNTGAVSKIADGYHAQIEFDADTYENWVCGTFTKTICEAKTRGQLLKAVDLAKSHGLEENKDFFLIRDKCLTELEPEEIDENGDGWTLTCIGFKPLPDDVAHTISRKYHLYV